ncbi:MAG TPA: hypothetical protein VMQ17_24810 [Candidatus Sulfotelmatobacter sp.]|nr:hypothetical protein [Candidatus Sulfotelmatobacter sp.]
MANIDASSAGIDVTSGEAHPRATLFTNSALNEDFAICNLTKGFSFDPTLVQTAFTFGGHVKFTGHSADFNSSLIGFVQFMSHEKAVITYLGQDPKAGHIVIDVGSAIGTSFLLDAFQHPQLPFMRPPGAIEGDGELLTSTGDHPVMSIRTVLRNTKTGAANSLFKILDVRRAVSIFTIKNAAGYFQHLTHVGWNLTYSIEFGILDGDLTVRHNLSTFTMDAVALGAPTNATFKGIAGPLAQLKPPLANVVAKAALTSTFTPGNPARRDLDGHPPGAPSDFEFTLPPITMQITHN